MVNFYGRFLFTIAEIQQPLNDLLKGLKTKGDTPVTWTPEADVAFTKMKDSLSDATLLVNPIANGLLSFTVDASDFAIGAVIRQYVDNTWQQLGFFSRSLTPAQQRFSTYDRDLLAIYASVKHFCHILEARVFCIYSDHCPITFAFQQKPTSISLDSLPLT